MRNIVDIEFLFYMYDLDKKMDHVFDGSIFDDPLFVVTSGLIRDWVGAHLRSIEVYYLRHSFPVPHCCDQFDCVSTDLQTCTQ